MATNFYDVVVHGDELTALVSAALLARRGLRVLVTGLEQTPATFSVGQHTFASGPGVLPSLDAAPVARVFRELNHLPLVRRRGRPLDPPLVLRVAGRQLALGPKAPALFRAVRESFPDQQAVLEGIFARLGAAAAMLDPLLEGTVALPARGFRQRRRMARLAAQVPPFEADLLAPLPPEHAIRAALVALAGLTARLAPGALGAGALAHAFASACAGAVEMPEALAGVRQLLIERIESASGDVRPVSLSALVFRRGKLVGVRLTPREEEVGLRQLVWAAPLAGLTALLGARLPRRLRDVATRIRTSAYRYRLCLRVANDAFAAEPWPDRLVSVRDPAKPPWEDNAILVHTGPAANEPRFQGRPMWVDCLVPAQSVGTQLNYLTVVRRRVLEHVAELRPGLERHLVGVASLHDGLPLEGRGSDGTVQPLTGIAPTPRAMPAVFTPDLPQALGVAMAAHGSGLRGLHLAGPEVLPGLGDEAAFVVGWSVAGAIAAPRARGRVRRRVIPSDG